MKRLFTILATMAFVATLSLGTVSCSQKYKITGEWDIVKICADGNDCSKTSGTLSFESDGSYSMTLSGVGEDEGKWSVKDGIITFKSDDGEKDKMKIKKLEVKKLVLKDKDTGVTFYLEKE